MSNIKLAISLYCFTQEYCQGKFTLEDCIRQAKEFGAEGYEMVATQMLPSYPFVSDQCLRELKAINEHYDIQPICYGANMDRGMRGNRDLTEDEMLQMAINDVKSAYKLGCKVIRHQYLMGPQVLTRLAPYAEAYDFKVGIEIHNPETPNTPYMREYLAAIQESGSKHIGFVPDFGLFATKPNKPHWDEALAAGVPLEILETARDLRYADVPMQETMERIRQMGATGPAFGAVQGMYGFVQFQKDCKKELEGLKEIMPYCYHMHGKFHYLDENDVEASIPYPDIMNTIKATDYDGYISAEYEDHTSGRDFMMTERYMNMMRRLRG